MAASTSLSLAVNLVGSAVYGYSVYYMNFNTHYQGIHSLVSRPLAAWGDWKYLTYQCLWFQLISSAVHVVAHFVPSLRKPRDFIFTALAFPVSAIVEPSFWGVWLTMGRELIFPQAIGRYYPMWLNHATHSIILPINLLLLIFNRYHYDRRGLTTISLYSTFYMSLTYLIKWQAGDYVYPYMRTLGDGQLAFYLLCTGALGPLTYKIGQLLSYLIHGRKDNAETTKQK